MTPCMYENFFSQIVLGRFIEYGQAIDNRVAF